ncbi:MAG: hypothetical protein JNM27_13735 [Leptospirales bacterium]|nr:hypothetical protein [Leptospirales bacterium]
MQRLKGVWSALAGSDESNMGVGKLSRAESEKCKWDPPVLTIAVERHGATVLGSINGDLQGWRINIDHMTAKPFSMGKRRLRPAAPRLDLTPLAEKFVEAVRRGLDDPCVRRLKDGRIQPAMKILLPEAAKETHAGRAKKLWGLLDPLMEQVGWERDGYFFRKKPE